MSEISIGRLRGGFCVYWRDPSTGRRARHKLEARTRAEAEAEAVGVYLRHAMANAPRGRTVADLWEAYREDLGSKPTATTMSYTGKAVQEHFGAYTPEQITKGMCVDYAEKRAEDGKNQGTIWTDLRHTAAVTMLSEAVPLEKVSQVLCHSNMAVTFSTYARFLPQHMQDAVDVLAFASLKRGA